MTPTIPAPTPELYERAAEEVGRCGWRSGVLGEELKPAGEEGPQPIPCCINGHLMLACGVKPDYEFYTDGAYNAVVAEVIKTIGEDEVPTNDYRLEGDVSEPRPAERLQDWNDEVFKSSLDAYARWQNAGWGQDSTDAWEAMMREGTEKEREILLKTAERLRAES